MKYLYNKFSKLLLLAVIVGMASCEGYDPEVTTSTSTPVLSGDDILLENGFTSFMDAVNHAGIASEVFGADTVTIFAPTNDAFTILLTDLGVASITDIDPTTLGNILKYHVIPGAVRSSILPATATSLQGATLSINTTGGVTINGSAVVVSTDRESDNAIVHGINRVLSIPAASVYAAISSSTSHTLLKAAIDAAGLASTLQGAGPFTVLAPNDDAFADAGIDAAAIAASTAEDLSDLLLFHVLSGRIYSYQLPEAGSYVQTLAGGEADGVQELGVEDGPAFNGANVVAANISTQNGVLHVVDAVIDEGFSFSDASALAGAVDNAIFGSPSRGFSNFFSLVNSTSFTDIYDISKQYVVYAQLDGPNNVSAFADEASAIAYITSRMFDLDNAIDGMPNGSRIVSIGGDEYFVASTGGGEYVNGGSRARNAFGATSTRAYSAYVGPFYKSSDAFLFSTGNFTPLPSTNLAQTVAAVDTLSMFSAALALTGLDDVVASGDHTLFAVGNTAFADATGYADAAEVAAETDEDVIDAIADILSLHIVPNQVQFSIVIGTELPDLETLSGEAMVFTSGTDGLSILTDPKDVANSQVYVIGADGLASNGVIHVLDQVITSIEE